MDVEKAGHKGMRDVRVQSEMRAIVDIGQRESLRRIAKLSS
jgi:hypothetical protein